MSSQASPIFHRWPCSWSDSTNFQTAAFGCSLAPLFVDKRPAFYGDILVDFRDENVLFFTASPSE